MSDDTTPTTFADAIEWIGRRSGHYAMKMEGSRVMVSVILGNARVSEIATSSEEGDLQAALIRAIRRIAGRSDACG